MLRRSETTKTERCAGGNILAMRCRFAATDLSLHPALQCSILPEGTGTTRGTNTAREISRSRVRSTAGTCISLMSMASTGLDILLIHDGFGPRDTKVFPCDGHYMQP